MCDRSSWTWCRVVIDTILPSRAQEIERESRLFGTVARGGTGAPHVERRDDAGRNSQKSSDTARVRLDNWEFLTTQAALTVLRKWVKAHGVPAALYADRRTVYFTEAFVHEPERRRDPAVFTEFMKVADRLGIEMIPAYSPQAKGRVERANKTLQDRLVKEFGLLGIGTIEAANAMLDGYAAQHNRRFDKVPARQADAHRAAPKGKEQWEYSFCTESQRVVQKDNTVSYNGEQWQILAQPGAPPPGSRIVRRRPLVGQPSWIWGEKHLRTRFLGRVRR